MTNAYPKPALQEKATIFATDLDTLIELYAPLARAQANGRNDIKGMICGPLFDTRPNGQYLSDIRMGRAPIPEEITTKLALVAHILKQRAPQQPASAAAHSTAPVTTTEAAASNVTPLFPAQAGPVAYPSPASLKPLRLQDALDQAAKVLPSRKALQDSAARGMVKARTQWQGLSPDAKQQVKRHSVTAAFALLCVSVPQMQDQPISPATPEDQTHETGRSFWDQFNIFSRGDVVSVPLKEARASDCHDGKPVIFMGARNRYEITNMSACRRLVDEAVPSIGQTIHYNAKMALTGNKDGSFTFHLEGRPDHKITPDNMRAMLEGWILSGGIEQNPIPFTFLLAKWNIESQHGNMSEGLTSSAKGINQFMPDTWVQRMMQYGHLAGYEDIHDALYDVFHKIKASKEEARRKDAARRKIKGKIQPYHLDYGDVAKDPRGRALFERFASNPHSSATLGVINSLIVCKSLQDALDNGDFPHPVKDENGAPLKQVTAAMCYVGHFLGPKGAVEYYKALAKTPGENFHRFIDRSKDIRDSAYKANILLLSHSFDVKDKNGQTQRAHVPLKLNELHEKLSRFGFDQRAIYGLSAFKIPERLSAGDLGVNIHDKDTPIQIDNSERAVSGIYGKPSFLLQVFENTTPELAEELNEYIRAEAAQAAPAHGL